MKIHHMTLKKYLRMLEQRGYIDVIKDSELYTILVERGIYNEYGFSFECGLVSYRFYAKRPEWA